MPARRIHVDMEKVAMQVVADCQCGYEAMSALVAEAEARGRERWKQWLSQYDDQGHLQPGVRFGVDYIPNMMRGFLAMSSDEQVAFIIAEKKRIDALCRL